MGGVSGYGMFEENFSGVISRVTPQDVDFSRPIRYGQQGVIEKRIIVQQQDKERGMREGD